MTIAHVPIAIAEVKACAECPAAKGFLCMSVVERAKGL
jgi:hypothetical protein